MEDLTERLGALLGDPNTLGQVQKIAQMLGLKGEAPEAPAAPPPAAAQGALGAASLLQSIGAQDDTTRFLSALRPLLSSARQKKLDEALRILRLIRLFPILRESGLLSSLWGGD